MDFDVIFRSMVDQQASDLFLKGGGVPSMRVAGRLTACGSERVGIAELTKFADGLMGQDRWRTLDEQRELNFAFERQGIGRFRANVMWQQGSLSLVIRRVQERALDFEQWQLPAEVLRTLSRERQGLLLVTGPTGNGKSTTVSTILEHINRTTPCHIVTLEDPIEFLFEERLAIVNQREVGVDTRSFTDGLKNVLRQNPDVLYLSDLRDQETMESALLAAESGQLVLSCVHTTNAPTTIERLVAFFPPHQHQLIRFRLSMVLKGIVCMRLLPKKDGKGLVPACEVMVTTPRVRELIREQRLEELPPLLHDGGIHGMQTQTQALYHLIASGQVTLEDAVRVADYPAELELAVKEIRATKDAAWR